MKNILFIWVIFSLALTGLLALPVLLIRAQPYAPHDLYTFYIPAENCHPPCFMNIQPGITAAEEVYHIIRDHAWVSRLFDDTAITDDGGIPGITGTISWEWSGAQPDWIDAQVRGEVRVRRGFAQFVTVSTAVWLGDVWLTLDVPDWEVALISERPDDLQSFIYRRSAYQQAGYLFETARVPCPASRLWKMPVSLTVWQRLALTPSTDDTARRNSGCGLD